MNLSVKTYCILILLAVGFILFIPWTGFPSANGDTYLYASYLVNPDFSQWSPIIHLGYYVMTRFFYFLVKSFGVSPLLALAMFSCLSGLFAAAGFFLFAEEMLGSPRKALLGALMLVISGFFWLHAMYGEVYVPQLCFVLFALLFLVKHRPLAGAVLFLLGISVTPTSLLILGFVLHLAWTGKISRKELGIFIFPASLLGCIAALWLYGEWIPVMKEAVLDPRFFLGKHSLFYLPWYMIRDAAYSTAKTFNLISIFILFGMGYLLIKKRTLFNYVLFAVLPFTLYILNLGLFTAEHLCLAFPFFCLAAAEGLSASAGRMSRKIQYAAGIPVFTLAALCAYFVWIAPALSEGRQMQDEIVKLAKLAKPDAAIIAPYHYGAAYWYRIHEKTDQYRLSGRPYLLKENRGDPFAVLRLLEGQIWINRGHLTRPETKKLLKEILLSGKDILFVDETYSPSVLASLLFSENRIEEKNKKKEWLPRLNLAEAGIRPALILASTRWPVYRLILPEDARIDWEARLFPGF